MPADREADLGLAVPGCVWRSGGGGRLATRWVKVRFLGQVNMNEREQFIIDACGARAAVSADGDARVRGRRSATSVAIGLALLPLQGEPDWVRDEDNVPLLGDGREEGVRG